MSRIAFIILICILLVIALPTTAQGPDTQSFTSPDGLFTLEFPTTWSAEDTQFALRLKEQDTVGNLLAVVDISYPGAGGMRIGEYAGLPPIAVIDDFRISLMEGYTLAPTNVALRNNNTVAYTSTQGTSVGGIAVDIFLMAVGLGGNHTALIYAETGLGTLDIYLPTLLTIGGSMGYSGPAAQIVPTPTAQPPGSQTPVPTTPTNGTPAPVTPQATIAAPDVQPATAFGRVNLYYDSGAITLYNASDATVSIEGIELVMIGTENRFISNDYGFFTQRFFTPATCIHIHINTQLYNAPSFCRPRGIRQLTYLFGDWANRYFVWSGAYNGGDSFEVRRGEEILATCQVAAGECSFDAPVSYIPYEPH